jgi:hypothetical protein
MTQAPLDVLHLAWLPPKALASCIDRAFAVGELAS